MNWVKHIGLTTLLAVLVGPAFAQNLEQAEKECRDNLELLMRSARKYAKDHQGDFPPNLQDLVPKYLATLPHCPLGNSDSYSRYSATGNHPPRLVLICASPNHALSPPDYLVLSSDREWEKPFSNQADPSLCRRALVTLGQSLEKSHTRLGYYPPKLDQPIDCSCGDPIRYQPSSDGKSFLAHCPGASHLGSGLAPFSPRLTPRGLQEDSLLIGQPEPAPRPRTSIPKSAWLAVTAVGVALAVFFLRPRGRRPIRLD